MTDDKKVKTTTTSTQSSTQSQSQSKEIKIDKGGIVKKGGKGK